MHLKLPLTVRTEAGSVLETRHRDHSRIYIVPQLDIIIV